MQHCGFSEIILYSFDNIVLPSLKHKTDNETNLDTNRSLQSFKCHHTKNFTVLIHDEKTQFSFLNKGN